MYSICFIAIQFPCTAYVASHCWHYRVTWDVPPPFPYTPHWDSTRAISAISFADKAPFSVWNASHPPIILPFHRELISVDGSKRSASNLSHMRKNMDQDQSAWVWLHIAFSSEAYPRDDVMCSAHYFLIAFLCILCNSSPLFWHKTALQRLYPSIQT